ncbi:LysR family transcriptional regulator [bacterium M00.F.Ca.ET.228.01.1.1]|uniref:LysR family transcriptional regulator n=1 Tax=Paraburkholderia phenoliruptrix TaxID=252970 RepID=UPI001092D369|nr:LysR family transcriptional regulator [Paraburkholderia phenoliruptrix]MBW9127882.1 LysR family transcriptional regulator [Paraburkholderia ginsengiterrae]TGP47886.1 LysR family transcriptional regulator [bacterium M00.F.Ca.ET.228.01.1.1]TGS05679.1 LysR family transcriptional regulator [bacterium M00.F.Ca.ET.191.01.1.1]TGU10615.1 LysR family transcriptional regulator [bacterium M00.F.Ca.ET.155.01.1.1]MBW0445309.1 LysR family transcriptional regulator [Paraburkholderia phenoliruptrix]
MQNLDALLIFARVAEMTSFTRAAESLGIQKGRVSLVIRELERDVGATLLHRTTRSVQLTEDGRAFYSRARDLLADVQELQSMFSSNGTPLRGRLRVDMPTELARSVVVPALPQLMAAHPELQLELSSTDRRVDLVQEGFDCVIRLGPIADESLIARPLGKLRMTNAASPSYLARHGIPHTLDDLLSQGHRMVHYTLTLGAKHAGWEYPHGNGYATLALPGAMQVNSVQTYHAAGLAGIGLIQAGYLALAHHIQSGALVEVLPDLRPEPLAASLVVAHRRNLSPRVRTFMDWIEGVLAPYFD